MSSIPRLTARYKCSPKMIRYAKNEGNMSQSTERDFEMTAITTPPNKDLTSHYKYIPYITESKEK